ncbi:uncharacterized protein [Aquarana catesbeiana]|uniref:uncharacterized protein n=1 Tax=Aquarana catesbeiana TaxID=8400 RepID=UPI003CCA05EF
MLQEVLNVITSDSGIQRKSPVPAVSQKAEATIEHQDILDWQYTAELIKELEKYLCEDPSDASFKEVEVGEASDFKTTDQPMLQEALNAITSDSGIQRKSPVPAVSQKAEATIEHQDILDWQYTAELIKELEKYLCEDPSDASFKEVEVGEASDFKTTDQPMLQEVLNVITSDSGIQRKSPVPAVSQKAEATIEHQDILDWQYTAELIKELEKYLCEDPSDASFKEVEVGEASDFKTTDQPMLQEALNAITSDSGIQRKSPVPAVSQKAEATIEHQDILDWQYTAELIKELEKYLCEDPSDARFVKYVKDLCEEAEFIHSINEQRFISQEAKATIEHQDIWQYTAEVVKELEKYLCEDPSDGSGKNLVHFLHHISVNQGSHCMDQRTQRENTDPSVAFSASSDALEMNEQETEAPVYSGTLDCE